MLRMIGIAVLFFCALYTGFELSASLKRTLRLLRGVHAFLRYAETQIECRGASYSDINASFPDSGTYPPYFTQLVREGGIGLLLNNAQTKSSLPEDAYSALEAFESAAGKSGREGQLAEIKQCSASVMASLERLSEEFPKKSKMYISLSAAAGLMLGILLL